MTHNYTIEQWSEAHWKSETRFYSAIIQQDLFANWMVTRQWGGRNNNLHGQKSDYVASPREATKRLNEIAKIRLKKGYRLCSN